MNKFLLGLMVLALAPIPAHAGTVADSGFDRVIAKQIAKETAQAAVKVALEVRAELANAKRKQRR